MPPAVIKKTLSSIGEKIESYDNTFFTYHTRPKYAKDITIVSDFDYHDTGIVIQGPVCQAHDFTIETVKLYKQFFRHVTIVVSTWYDTPELVVNKLKNAGAIVLLNRKPEMSGALNANYQIISTRNGIEKLKEFGVIKYVLKTRADQRIYNPNSISLFKQLQKQYPPITEQQKERIVSVNFTTLKYRPFALGDMCMFGYIDDIFNYWDIKFDKRELTIKDTLGKQIIELTNMNVGETFYCRNYLQKLNVKYELTISDSWNIYRELFIVVDYELVDLFWFKYNRMLEHKHRYYKRHTFELFTYDDWLSVSKNTYFSINTIDGIKII